MIATNTVKINGIIYRAGDELPSLSNNSAKAKEDKKTVKAIDKAITETIETPKVLLEETEIEKLAKEEKVFKDIPKFTKTQLQKMTTAELRELGADLKIEDAKELSGGKLKKIILAMVEENYAED